MPKTTTILKKLREICLEFPDTKETITWGKPHFRVGEKIFAGFDDQQGIPVMGCKLEMSKAKTIIDLDGFSKAPYVGHKGWVSVDLSVVSDWELIRELVTESYQLIAPKKSLKKLEGGS